ncbi:UDP-N-acetylmuramoyl-tripeptide--D-alanyl-D-alanine ligase [Rickettsia endosymbiont of Cardiosporidium cionae]|uniref:UDP-N-acetylmuramoyl-tripeptide--D-alanyl-D- alanine ligase n=1 Tax=Rickettsia endosymbiont of Cardiosporidium cionae TaxID=2777155 RepID=UPI00189464CF|nr:UDP-N-acetylmuramoyl-tripeptide--D-alanyl-D-alanine ligase [Rickettsia endosymbiont of Cardiosporidium cionae]KAF8818980.1 UDP-N-acetylmuramoyl-tripeptide--D-alanyl-D-alanine ligase [Rickettsia endosymbiont of Cardiosporidium cionae]
MIWSVQEIEEALSMKLPLMNKNSFLGRLEFNSQNIQEGDIFVTLPGSLASSLGGKDGHDFVFSALAKGAAAVILDRDIEAISEIDPKQLIKVSDSFYSLELLARYKRAKSKALFVAITGSYGKTTTKDLVALMLSAYGKTFRGRRNFNNQLGVLMNLASMPDDIEYSVLEVSVAYQGDIIKNATIVKPDISIVTSVSETHLESLKNVETVAKEKSEIFSLLDNNKGIAILNRDSNFYNILCDKLNDLNIQNILTFGRSENADVVYVSYKSTVSDLSVVNGKNLVQNSDVVLSNCVSLEYLVAGKNIKFDLSELIAEHMGENFLSGFAVLHALNLDISKALEVIPQFRLRASRGKIVHVNKYNKQHNLICDYFNNNPYALKTVINYLDVLQSPHKIAVVGDMLGLGEQEVNLHIDIIKRLLRSSVQQVVFIGSIFKSIIHLFQEEFCQYKIKNNSYIEVKEFISEIEKVILSDSLILIKGSRKLNLEKIVEHFGVVDVL